MFKGKKINEYLVVLDHRLVHPKIFPKISFDERYHKFEKILNDNGVYAELINSNSNQREESRYYIAHLDKEAKKKLQDSLLVDRLYRLVTENPHTAQFPRINNSLVHVISKPRR